MAKHEGGRKRAKARRGRGEGSIFQREDGLWVGSASLGYDAAGKRLRPTVYGKTKKEVQDGLDELKQKAKTGSLAKPSKLTVGQYLDEWLAGPARSTAIDSTLASYESYVRLHVKPLIGAKVLTKVTPFDVDRVLAAMEAKGRPARTRQYVRAILHRAFKVAVQRDILPKNPVDRTTSPKVPRAKIRPLTPEEASTLVTEAKADPLYALYALALMGGMRQGELLGLKWSDIDFANATVSITRKLYYAKATGFTFGPPKSEKGRRAVVIPGVAVTALVEHREWMSAAGLGAPEFVFLNEEGRHFTRFAVLSRWYTVLRRAGLPKVRFHDLRHSAATLLLAAGEHPKVVQERLGHSTIALTMDTYSHVMPSMQKAAADKLDEMFGGARKKA